MPPIHEVSAIMTVVVMVVALALAAVAAPVAVAAIVALEAIAEVDFRPSWNGRDSTSSQLSYPMKM